MSEQCRPKVGDRVRVNPCDGHHEIIGKEGIIIEDDLSDMPFWVKLDGGRERWFWPFELTILPAAPDPRPEHARMTALTEADLDRLEAGANAATEHHGTYYSAARMYAPAAEVIALIAIARRARRMEEALQLAFEMRVSNHPEWEAIARRAILSEPHAMTSAELNKLAARVEALHGPCRETDAEVACSCDILVRRESDRWPGGYCFIETSPGKEVWPGQSAYQLVPNFTASLDTAATLVPDGHWWEVGRDTSDDSPLRNFGASNGGCFRAQVEAWSASVRNRVTAATPALALCAAALRARAKCCHN